MPPAAWTGSIGFGLVSIPVKLYPAVRSRAVRFNQIDTRTGARVRQKRVSAADGSEVPTEAIAKGVERDSGNYVVFTDDELKALDPPSSHVIEIEQFVQLSELDPIIYSQAYNVVPDGEVVKPYALLLRAMEDAGRVAIARFTMRTAEHLAALRPAAGRLVLSTLVYADEVNDPADFGPLRQLSEVQLDARELEMAGHLLDSLTEPFHHDAYKDRRRERLLEMIERKSAGAEPVVEGEPAGERPATVIDLMAALEASVEERQAARGRHPAARAGGGAAGAGGAAKGTRARPAAKKAAGPATKRVSKPASKSAAKAAPAGKAAAKKGAEAPARRSRARKAS